MILALLIVWKADLVQPTNNYLDYFDCRRPTTIRTYEAHMVCQNHEPKEKPLKIHHVFQEQTVQTTTGYKCQVKQSKQTYTCGTWSHYRLAKPTEFMHPLVITKSHCAEMVRFQQYKTNTGESFPLTMDTITTFSYAQHGVLTEGASETSCQGESVKLGNHIFSSLMVLVELQVLVSTQHFVIDIQNQKIETTDDHLGLPCHAADLACITALATYVWSAPEEHCPLRKIRTIAPLEVLGTYLYDPQQKVLLNKTEPVAQTNCAGIFFGTSLRGILVSSDPTTSGIPNLEPKYLRMDLMVSMTADYLAFQEERRIQTLNGQLSKQLCEDGTYNTRTMKINQGRFARRTGDGIIVYSCPSKVGTVAELENCYEDIPIMSREPQLFVDPITRIVKTRSTQIPCNVHFPLLVKTQQGYLSISPHLKKVPTPSYEPLFTEDGMPPHEDMTAVSLYTPSEIESWENFNMFPTYHQALLKTLTIGVCAGSSTCSHVQDRDDIEAFDLSRLNPVTEMGWIGDIKKGITDAGAYMSALVLIIYALKLIINIVIFSFVLFKEGMNGLAAYLIYSCCSHSRVMKRIRKTKKEEPEEETHEMAETTTQRRINPQSILRAN